MSRFCAGLAGDVRIPFPPPNPGTSASPRNHPPPCSPGRYFTRRTARPGTNLSSSALGTAGGSELSLIVTNSLSRSCSRHALYTAVYYSTLLTASHKHEMFKIEKTIAEKSTSKNYAGVNSSSNWSPANRSLKRETVVLCCYKNINANYQISGLKSQFKCKKKLQVALYH